MDVRNIRAFGNIRIPNESLVIGRAYAQRQLQWRRPMIRFALFGAAAILSAAIATPVLGGGQETLTRPWSAPVGHRQPRAADIPASISVSQPPLDQENANVDRKIRNICRAC